MATTIGELKLIGERLCMDFVNTVDFWRTDNVYDYMCSYADLLTWGQHVGILGEAKATELRERAAREPQQAEATLAQARELRNAMYRIFFAASQHQPTPTADLTILNKELRRAMSMAQLIPLGDGHIWVWPANDALDQMLWPTVRSAAEVLTSGELAMVKACESESGCGWLFVDTSKNHRRRWCSMEDCGNTAKVRRFRKKQGTTSASLL